MSKRTWIFLALVIAVYVFTPSSNAISELEHPILVVRIDFQEDQSPQELTSWLDIWEVHRDVGYLIAGVTPKEYVRLTQSGYSVKIDLEKSEEFNRPHTSLPEQTSGIPGYPCYRTVEETFASAQFLVTNHPNLVTWLDIGDSWDKINPGGSPGYDLMVLRLTNAKITGIKPKLFIMAAIHAREYATSELVTRFAEYLVNNYDIDPDITWILDHHEIHILLFTNPDGRKYAETGYNWRKNTDANYCTIDSTYRGADLNRNFEFQWGCCNGSSSAECDYTYRGPLKASEPETQAVQNYIRNQFPDQREDALPSPAPENAMGVFLDIHSYGNLVLWPWGFTSQVAPNASALQTLGRKFTFFNTYKPDQSIYLYPTDGTTDDFAYGELGLASYTFEIGNTFFEPCKNFESLILTTNLEVLKYAAKVARLPYLIPSGPDATNLVITPNIAYPGDPLKLFSSINDTRYYDTNGNEPTQNISGAEYYIDVPPWITNTIPISNLMWAADGSYMDEKIEDVISFVDTTNLTYGRHLLFARGKDDAGYWGPISAVFFELIKKEIFLEPSSLSTSGNSGSTVTFLLRITNQSSNPVSFSIIVEENSWITKPSTTQIGPLPKGSSADFSVNVQIPINSHPGLSDSAKILVIPSTTGIPSTSSRITTYTSGGLFQLFPFIHK